MDQLGCSSAIAVMETEFAKVEVEENEEVESMVVGLGEENSGF